MSENVGKQKYTKYNISLNNNKRVLKFIFGNDKCN